MAIIPCKRRRPQAGRDAARADAVGEHPAALRNELRLIARRSDHGVAVAALEAPLCRCWQNACGAMGGRRMLP